LADEDVWLPGKITTIAGPVSY